MEGPVETRGPGVVGRWKQQWGKLDDKNLSLYAPGSPPKKNLEGQILLSSVTNLSLEEGGSELSFHANGTKVRLRGPGDPPTRSWFGALQAALVALAVGGRRPGPSPQAGEQSTGAAVPPKGPGSEVADSVTSLGTRSMGNGGRASRSKGPPANGSASTTLGTSPGPGNGLTEQLNVGEERPLPISVWVQVDTVNNLPQQGSRPGRYTVNARWDSASSGQSMEERVGKPSGAGEESCTVRQQVFVLGECGQNTIAVSVERRSQDSDGTDACWTCTIPLANKANFSARVHRLVDQGGSPTPASVRLKLKLAQAGEAGVEEQPAKTPAQSRRQAPGESPSPPRSRAFQPPSRRSGDEDPAEQAQSSGHAAPIMASGSAHASVGGPPTSSTRSSVSGPVVTTSHSPRQSVGGTTSSRIDELHSMHIKRQKERQEKYDQARKDEVERFAKEADALKRVGSVGQFKRTELSAEAASERLYRQHKDMEQRLRLMQEKKEMEERELLEAARIKARPARGASPAGVASRDVGARLHALQAELSEKRQRAAEERVAAEMEQCKQVGVLRKATDGFHEKLHDDSKKRKARLEKAVKEKEERERLALQKASIGRARAPNKERIDELFNEHAERLRRANLSMAEAGIREISRAMQQCACGNMFRPSDTRCPKCLTKRPESTALEGGATSSGQGAKAHKSGDDEIFSRQLEAQRKRDAAVEEMRRLEAKRIQNTCACGHPFDADLGARCRKCGAKRVDAAVEARGEQVPPERGGQAHAAAQHAAMLVNRVVALRCGFTQEETPAWALRPMLEPLQAAMDVIRQATQGSERGCDGFSHLRARSSQRLFMDGLLMDDVEAWQKQCEPDPIRQLEEDFDTLMQHAEAAQLVLLRAVVQQSRPDADDSEGRWAPGQRFPHPHAATTALFAHNPGVKPRAAAELKARVLYGPAEGPRRFRHLLDLARLSLVFPDCVALRSGLEQLLEQFEVVDVRNHYQPHSVGLLGERCVELLVVVKQGLAMPHVCEIRLEELSFFEARSEVEPKVRGVCERLATMYASCGADADAIAYLASNILRSPAEVHNVRIFRRHLARVFGSCAVAWRRVFGSNCSITFWNFREMCHQLSTTTYQARGAEYWQCLDAGRAGCISLFEFDPQAVVLMAKIRERVLGRMPGNDAIDVDELFHKLAAPVTLAKKGVLVVSEFRAVMKKLGFDKLDADRAFSCLDMQGGSAVSTQGQPFILAKDFLWLLKLPSLVDVDSVMLLSAANDKDLGALRTRWASTGPKNTAHTNHGQAQKRNSSIQSHDVAPMSARASASMVNFELPSHAVRLPVMAASPDSQAEAPPALPSCELALAGTPSFPSSPDTDTQGTALAGAGAQGAHDMEAGLDSVDLGSPTQDEGLPCDPLPLTGVGRQVPTELGEAGELDDQAHTDDGEDVSENTEDFLDDSDCPGAAMHQAYRNAQALALLDDEDLEETF